MTTPETEFVSILDAAEKSDAAPRISSRSLPDTLPILGLSDIVIFPGSVLPLLVETGPSLRLIDDAVAGDRLLGAVLQRRAEVVDPRPEDLYAVGCVVRLAKMVKLPDGPARVLVEGLWRIRIRDYLTPAPYLRAHYELLRDETEDSIELQAMLRSAHRQFEEIARMSTALPDQVKITALNTEHPGHFADLIAANLNLSLELRQELLETVSVRERLQKLLPLLNREQEVLTLSSKIQSDVASSIAKSQRDFFLREQIRAIQRELGEGEQGSPETKSLRERIEQAPLPEEARKTALQELERLQQTPPAAAEYAVSRNYLDWILNLPWARETDDKLDLKAAARILNEQHFGLEKIKERLLEFLAVIKRRKQIKGPILCLVGPPGVGKTSLGKSVADSLGRKFARISLGGMRDEAEIRGHRRTYVGSLPGRILQTLRRVESRNPVILLDELDKVGADFRGDPAAALLEVLDPEQNNTFTDHYLDLPFDLSRVLFITTANWLEPIHPALRDRLEVIELPSYTDSEKLQIARRYLVPRQIEEHGLTRQDVRFTDGALRELVREYTREAGVRQLEREIAALARKTTRKIAGNGAAKTPVVITRGLLRDFLGAPKFVSETAGKITEFGIATGLAWTPVGGDILFIEATRMRGRGHLILTGSLGDVMKESAQAAVSYLRSQAKKLDLDFDDYGKYDLHIHVPAGATPKDGPSAGVAIVAALASLLSKRRVRSEAAMTGEISLRGRVLRVGGVKEKVLAAQRFGLKEVILPEQNKSDWLEVPAEARAKLKAHFVRQIAEVLPLALEPK
ncbi:MAG: endopeptidase La [Verrucomicrobiota bacterium]|nr:endopeptidase La [Verrucomicrobiota bacterium]